MNNPNTNELAPIGSEREAFEKWAVEFMGLDITPKDSCGYVNPETNGAWLGWGAERRQAMGTTPPAAPVSAEPLFWYRPRSDDGYEGPLHNGRVGDVRKASGAWVPLFAGTAPVSVEPINWPAVEGRISDFVGEYEMVGEDGHGREGYYIPNEHERALIADAVHGLLNDSEVMALLRPAAPVAAQAQPYSLNLDPAGIRALTADAITGALALGAQGAEQPPADHWLKPFYEMGRQSAAEEMAVVPAVAQKFAERLSAALKSLDRRHFNGVNVQLAIRDVVHSFTRIDASDVAAMAQPERHAENTETVVCGCGDLYPTGSYGAGFIAAAGHCENCDAAKGTDVDKADAERLNLLRDHCLDLRCISAQTGGDDAEIHWIVVEHHMAEPRERVIGRAFNDDPRAAIDAARKEVGHGE